jgi:hypothetical protein
MRRPKTDSVPRTRAGGEWTEASFWQFIRSGLRQMSRRWPPIIRQRINANRRKNQSDNKRLKWEFRCDACNGWFPRKSVQVDHIIACGQLKSWADMAVFAERLFCEADGLRVLCGKCHDERHSNE